MAQISFSFRKSISGLGVDFGSEGVKAVELGWDRDGAFLLGAGREALPAGAVLDGATDDPDAVGEALARLFARIGARTREVAVAVGGNSVFIRRLPPPAADPSSPGFRDAVAREAARHVPLHIESLEFDWVAAPEDSPEADAGTENEAGVPAPAAIVFGAAPRPMVRAHCDAVTRSGRAATRVDLEPYALFAAARLAAANPDPPPRGPVAFVEVGARRVSVHVFAGAPGPGGEDVPGDLLASVEAPPGVPPAPGGLDRTEMGDAGAGARIVATFREALREAAARSVARVWASGGGSLSKPVGDALRDGAGGAPIVLDPVAAVRKGPANGAETPSAVPGDGPAFAIAAGLASIQIQAAVRSRRGSR